MGEVRTDSCPLKFSVYFEINTRDLVPVPLEGSILDLHHGNLILEFMPLITTMEIKKPKETLPKDLKQV